jgi:hypothetical protein
MISDPDGKVKRALWHFHAFDARLQTPMVLVIDFDAHPYRA